MNRRPAGDARLEVEDPGEPELDGEAAEVGAPVDEEGQPVEGEVLEPAWDADSVEETLMGLWNFQVLYYGLDYAAELGELRPAAERLVPVFQEHVPTQMRGVVGNVAGAGLIAGTGVAMWQKEKRVRARRAPQGPVAALLGRRRPRPGAPQAGQEQAAAPPSGPGTSDPASSAQQPADEPKRVFSAEEEAAIRAHQGGPGDNPLEGFGLGL